MDVKPGDVVVLKSGGHPLTVIDVNDQHVECIWLGEAGDLFRETLPLIALENAVLDIAEQDDENGDDEEDDDDGDEEKDERDVA